MSNSIQPNSNYGDLNLQELKDLADKREIIPEGNKTLKDTWREALERDDQLKAITNNNSEAEANSTIEASTTNKQDIPGQSVADANGKQQVNDELSIENPSIDEQDLPTQFSNSSSDQQSEGEIFIDNTSDNQAVASPVDSDIDDRQQFDSELPLDNSADQAISTPVIPDTNKQLNDELFAEEPSTEAQDYILENIVTPLDQRRVDVDRLEVNLDGRNIFKLRDGDVANSQVTDSQAELIKQALNDPASFEGTVKITNGRQVLLHVKDGQVIRDGLNLTKQTTKIEISSSNSDLYDKYSQNLSNDGSLKTTKQVAKNALSDGITKEQVKDIIKSQDPGYQNLAASSNETTANNSLNKIVASAAAEIKNRNSQNNSEQLKKTPALSR